MKKLALKHFVAAGLLALLFSHTVAATAIRSDVGFGGSSAVAGWTNGAGTYFQFDGSGVNGALLDGGPNALISDSLNSRQSGRYLFQVRSGAIVDPPPEVPASATWALFELGFAMLALRRRQKVA